MSKKNILFSAYAFYPEFGGLEQQIYLLSQEYIKQGHSVTVLTEKASPASPQHEIIDGVTVYRLPYTKSRTVLDYLILILSLSWYIIKTRNKYSGAHLRAALTLYPIVFGFWKRVGVITYSTVVTADTGGSRDEIIKIKEWPFSTVMVYLCKAHNWFNSICKENYQHYTQLSFPKHKLTKISNGIDTSQFSEVSYPKKVKHFLFLARLIKEKGIYELLEAFKRFHSIYPETKLYIGGDGIEKENILNFIQTHGLTKTIIFKGYIASDDIEAFYNLGECLVQPSYSEGFGLVYAEAAARKKIIIATDVADLKMMYGNTIFFCEKRDIESVYKTLIRVYETKSFSHIDYKEIIEHIDIKKVAHQYLSLLD